MASPSSRLGTQPSPRRWSKVPRDPAELCYEPQHQLLKAQPDPQRQWRRPPEAAVPVLRGPTTHHGFTPNRSSSELSVPILYQTLLPRTPIRDIHSSTPPCFQAPGLLFKETFANCFKKCKPRPSAPCFWMLPYLLETLLQGSIEYFYYGTHI